MSTPEYDDLEREFPEVVSLLRGGLPGNPDERPTESVWDAIAGELDLSGRSTPQLAPVPPVAGHDPAEAPATEAPATRASGEGSVVRDIGSARSRRWGRSTAILTAVAAAILLVAVPLGLALSDGSGPEWQAELAALEGFDGTGEAEVEGRDLRVRFDGSEPPDGSLYELWLLDLEGTEVVDLEWIGVVDVDEDGSFALPDEVDLDRFDVVDVSVEPDDGNPEHSGASILRGGLVGA